MEVSLKACQKESNPHTSGWISRDGGEALPSYRHLARSNKNWSNYLREAPLREESDNSGFALDGSDAAGYEMICTWQF